MSTRVWSAGVGLVVALMLVSGCAGTGTSPAATSLPPAKMLQPADLAGLAGEWQGTLRRGGQGPGPASIAERSGVGRVEHRVGRVVHLELQRRHGDREGRIEGGKLVFEGSGSRGTATLHEGDGRRILKGEGTWVGYSGNSEFELTKR